MTEDRVLLISKSENSYKIDRGLIIQYAIGDRGIPGMVEFLVSNDSTDRPAASLEGLL